MIQITEITGQGYRHQRIPLGVDRRIHSYLSKFPRWRNAMHVHMFWAKEHIYYKKNYCTT